MTRVTFDLQTSGSATLQTCDSMQREPQDVFRAREGKARTEGRGLHRAKGASGGGPSPAKRPGQRSGRCLRTRRGRGGAPRCHERARTLPPVCIGLVTAPSRGPGLLFSAWNSLCRPGTPHLSVRVSISQVPVNCRLTPRSPL